MTTGVVPARLGLPPGPGALGERAAGENFPVATRLLPRRVRADLMAVYGFARFVDCLGDELDGGTTKRLAALDAAETELALAIDGRATHPVFAALMPVMSNHRLDPQPFRDLIEANRRDQLVTTYTSYDELLDYCRLSANPVGRIVLGLAGVDAAAEPHLAELSDGVCSGLQIVEHLQDVAEDARAGRIYVPADDMARFGVLKSDLVAAGPAPARLRRLVAFETGRAKRLLGSGAELSGHLHGFLRLAVAGYAGGGLAQVAALEACGYDVTSGLVKARRRAVARRSAAVLRRTGNPRRAGGAGRARGAGKLALP